jgi:pimeloyl-ACP methyl ester carboxylesterase
VAEEIGRLAEQNDDYSGREMMRRALPYYSGRSGNLPDLYFEYHNDTYNTVLDTAGDYELTAALEDASIPTRMIFGSTDHITPDLFRDFVGPRLRASPAITIDGGHFAFADSPTAFCDAVLST